VLKKTKKVRGANTKANVKATHTKARSPAAKKLAKRTEGSLPRNRKMKMPVLQVSEPQVNELQRTDLAPTNGFSLIVDGQIKAQFDAEGAAKKAAKELLANYPMLKVEIHDASTKHRTLVSN
jgi:hypothetical protein